MSHVTWASDSGGRSRSTEQLDKLLRGLDELSGTLPDLGGRIKASSSAGNGVSVGSGQLELRQQQATSGSMRNGAPPSPHSNSVTHQARKNGARSYEDDLDYVLEKELGAAGGGGGFRPASAASSSNEGGAPSGGFSLSASNGDGAGGASGGGIGSDQGGSGIKGQEVRPLVNVDNYAKVYGGGGGGSSSNNRAEPQPYHTRYDSKPFSYIRQNPSREMSRCSSREALDSGRAANARMLESPSLLRRVMGAASLTDFDTPPASPIPFGYNSSRSSPSPQLQFHNSGSTVPSNSSPQHQFNSLQHNNNSHRHSPSPQTFSSPESSGLDTTDRSSYSKSIVASTYLQSRTVINKSSSSSLVATDNGSARQIPNGATSVQNGANGISAQQHQQNGGLSFRSRLDFSVQPTSGHFRARSRSEEGSSSYSRTEEERETWLQKQQRKLQERRQLGGIGYKEPSPVIQELKSSLNLVNRTRSNYTETTDGYASDVNSIRQSETSRESSPAKQLHSSVPIRDSIPQSTPQRTELHNVDLGGIYSSVNKRATSQVSRQQQEQQQQYQELKQQQLHQQQQQVYQQQQQQRQLYEQQQQEHQLYQQQQQYQQQQEQLQQRYLQQQYISRQKSDTSFDRSRPYVQKKRHDSESDVELELFRNGNGSHHLNSSFTSLESSGLGFGSPASRPITPAFPVASTPYFNQTSSSSNTLPPKSPFGGKVNGRLDLTARAPSPAGSVYGGEVGMTSSRRGSVSSEPTEVAASNVKLVKDNYKFWYKKTISREAAITQLRDQPPGTFIVRDSNSFPGAFGLALKVATLAAATPSNKDASSEYVRHFLIEPTSKGVKLKGYSNEPVFASLSALIYQHTITALALPCRLVLPQYDLGGDEKESTTSELTQLLQFGAACNVFYLFSLDTDQLTGPQAVRKTVSQMFLIRPLPQPTTVHFKVSGQGITLTDQARRLFFRKHFPAAQISHCGLDPEDRRWSLKKGDSVDAVSAAARLFAFVARRPTQTGCNQCHVFAELDPDQPAHAIVNFVNKLMLTSSGGGGGGGGGQLKPQASDMV